MDVYTFGGGDYLSYLFTSMSTMYTGGLFGTMGALAGTLGLLWIMITALQMKGPPDLGYIVRWGILYLALVGPGTTVVIHDNLLPMTTSSVIPNVPLGVAAIASISSSIGSGLEKAYDTAFLLPMDYQYSTTGLDYGQAMLSTLVNYSLAETDPALAQDLVTFTEECLFTQMDRGLISPSTFETTNSLNNVYFNPATYSTNRFITLTDPALAGQMGINGVTLAYTNGETTLDCASAATDLGNLFNSDQPAIQQSIGGALFPNGAPLTYTNPVVAAVSTAGSALNDIAGVAVSGSNAIQQAALLSVVRDSLDTAGTAPTGSGFATSLASAKADREQSTTYAVMGQMAQRLVPEIHILLEGILYAAFPVILLFALLPNGLMALGTYLGALVWVQSWPLLFSIINSIHYVYSHDYLPSIISGVAATPTFSATTAGAMGAFASQMSTLSGYMALSVPMIAYMIVNGGAQIGSSVASHLTGPAQGAAASAGAQVSSGNISMDTLTMGTRTHDMATAFQTNTAPSVRTGGMYNQSSDGIGHRFVSNGAGGTNAITDLSGVTSNMGAISASGNAAVSSVIQQGVSQSQTAVAHAQHAFGSSQMKSIETASGFTQAHGMRGSDGASWSKQDATSLRNSTQTMDDVVSKVSHETGVDASAVKSWMASASIGGSGGLHTPGGKGSVFGAGANFSGTTQMSATDQQKLAEHFSAGKNASEANRFTQAFESASTAAHNINSSVERFGSKQDSASATNANRSVSQASAQLATDEQVSAGWQSLQQKNASGGLSVSANMSQVVADAFGKLDQGEQSYLAHNPVAMQSFATNVLSSDPALRGSVATAAQTLAGGENIPGTITFDAQAGKPTVSIGPNGATVATGSGGSLTINAPSPTGTPGTPAGPPSSGLTRGKAGGSIGPGGAVPPIPNEAAVPAAGAGRKAFDDFQNQVTNRQTAAENDTAMGGGDLFRQVNARIDTATHQNGGAAGSRGGNSTAETAHVVNQTLDATPGMVAGTAEGSLKTGVDAVETAVKSEVGDVEKLADGVKKLFR